MIIDDNYMYNFDRLVKVTQDGAAEILSDQHAYYYSPIV